MRVFGDHKENFIPTIKDISKLNDLYKFSLSLAKEYGRNVAMLSIKLSQCFLILITLGIYKSLKS